MPEPAPGQSANKAQPLEAYWEKRFEASAQQGDDAARNIGRSFGHRERRSVFQDLAAKHLPQSARSVLDIGCGSGTYFDLYTKLGLKIHGLDFSPAQLANARRNWPEARLAAGELAAAPPDFVADLVVCIGVVQVVTDLPAFVNGMADRVRPGGTAIVSCLEKNSIWPGSITDPHLRFYSRAHMRGLFSPRFLERECRRFYPLPFPFSIVRPLLYRTQLPWLNHGLMFVLSPKHP